MTRFSKNDGDEMVDVECTVKRTSMKAYLIEDCRGDEHWVPKSQSSYINGNFRAKRWFLEKNEIPVGSGITSAPASSSNRNSDDGYDLDRGGPVDYDDEIPF